MSAPPMISPSSPGYSYDSIWNGHARERLEILDWYYLMQNSGNVSGPPQGLDAVEACLWQEMGMGRSGYWMTSPMIG